MTMQQGAGAIGRELGMSAIDPDAATKNVVIDLRP